MLPQDVKIVGELMSNARGGILDAPWSGVPKQREAWKIF